MQIDIWEVREGVHNMSTKFHQCDWEVVCIGDIENVEAVVNELTLYLEQIKQPTAQDLSVNWPSSGVEG